MEGQKETVSIVVPVYNAQMYLREAVESVCGQTYPDWELLLVDDGSTDQSGRICDEYAQKDSRIRVFHTVNRGVSCARNLGIENAGGNWISFMDSDDYLNTRYLETLLKHAKGMDLVVCSTQNIPSGELAVLSEKVEIYSSLQDTQKELDRFRSYFYSSVWNKLYRRDKVTMRFNPKLSLGEDWWFNVQYMQDCHGICVLPDILNYHRKSTENSLTKQFRIHAMEDASSEFYAQAQLFGTSQKAKALMNENFGRMMMNQSLRLARNGEYSLKEKKAILDHWANHAFWEEEALDISAIRKKRQAIYLNLLKHKKTWRALLCCHVFAIIMDWKSRRRSPS